MDDYDFLLLGCDGLWETKTDQQITKFIQDKMLDQQEQITIIEELLDFVIAQGHEANKCNFYWKNEYYG